jgi:VIT1/CCC1 family predicted Fe2+/Mn2+ transporter
MESDRHQQNDWLGFNRTYISEFVYGGIDGAITTFAVVAGSAGAKLDLRIILVLGFANLLADGFSMSVGNYFSTKAEHDNYEKHRQLEYWEIEHLPETETQEIRDIYRKKGFEGDLLEQVVAVITRNKEVWVDTMMKEELEMIPDGKTPMRTAIVTFVSFFLIGLIPLLAYVAAVIFSLPVDKLFWISSAATAFGLALIGLMKSVVTAQSRMQGVIETVALGGVAAFLAYWVGAGLERMLT